MSWGLHVRVTHSSIFLVLSVVRRSGTSSSSVLGLHADAFFWLQFVAVCCSVLQCVTLLDLLPLVLQFSAVYCNVFAVCCILLQRVTVGCSILLCVACCNVDL